MRVEDLNVAHVTEFLTRFRPAGQPKIGNQRHDRSKRQDMHRARCVKQVHAQEIKEDQRYEDYPTHRCRKSELSRYLSDLRAASRYLKFSFAEPHADGLSSKE